MPQIPDRAEIVKVLRNKLTPGLLEHCLRTEALAVEFASLNEMSINDAAIAALLHDYGKCIGKDKLLKEAVNFGLDITDADRAAPFLLHAPIGAAMAGNDFDLAEDIIHAIEAHTYGRPEMTKFDKMIYMADGLEPGRSDLALDRIRTKAYEDLDGAFKELFAYTLKKLIDGGSVIHPVSIVVWNSIAS